MISSVNVSCLFSGFSAPSPHFREPVGFHLCSLFMQHNIEILLRQWPEEMVELSLFPLHLLPDVQCLKKRLFHGFCFLKSIVGCFRWQGKSGACYFIFVKSKSAQRSPFKFRNDQSQNRESLLERSMIFHHREVGKRINLRTTIIQSSSHSYSSQTFV